MDVDGNPLIIGPFWQKALFFGLECAAYAHITLTCLWPRNVMDAAFCR